MNSVSTADCEDAARLLRYAAERPGALTHEVTAPIIAVLDAPRREAIDTATSVAFWRAVNALAAAIHPATIDSIRPAAIRIAARRRHAYYALSFLLLVLIVPLSILSFASSAISNDIDTAAASVCTLIQCGPTLGPGPSPPQPLLRPAAPAADAPAPADNAPATAASAPASATKDWTATDWALFRAAQFISYHLVWLNDIYFWWGRGANHDEIAKEIADIATVTNIYAHFYVLAATTTKVQSQNRIFYGVIGGYILPVLYALLGATAFGLRALSEEIATSTVQRTAAARAYMRLMLAALTGSVIGLFSDFTKGLLLSPLAAAFLVGYGVEIVFAFLDAVIRSARSARFGVPGA
ncbi:MAG TPA: hypothetical protein VEI03_11225 [Stellaceae bacterium]|nr:hypothetical protein [Stellaceae bacterium]